MSEKESGGGGGFWRREGSAEQGFRYLRGDGKPLRSVSGLRRIESLVIPPAWTDVRIAPRATDKVQAVGKDAAGRKQYIYHPTFVAKRSRRKYTRVEAFARVLPRLRTVTNEHLRTEGLNRQRVLATMVRLMSRAYFRVGSERYAIANQTFGLTTLRKKHLRIEDNNLIFSFKGKSGVQQRRVVAATPLVEIMKQLMELPGRRLFRYYDEEGKLRDVTARAVNEYIKEILGAKFTSKDIRTWGGTVRAAVILSDLGPAKKPKEAEKNVALVCKLVAMELGNTPSVCRSAYIHPVVLERYLSGRTMETVTRRTERPVEADSPVEYYPEEAALIRFLEGKRR